jgi:hypothetical protein
MSEIDKLQGEFDDTLKEMAELNRMTCLNGLLGLALKRDRQLRRRIITSLSSIAGSNALVLCYSRISILGARILCLALLRTGLLRKHGR